MSKADGLKPCPFCGGEPMVHETDWCEPPEFSVHCQSCSASTISRTNKAAAGAAWNHRQSASRARAEERARIERLLREPSEAMVEAMRHANLHEVDAPLYQRICRAIAAILAAPEETGDG